MEKIAVVIRATGNQGGSVVKALKATGGYRVRGVTTNVMSEKSKELTASGVEMVVADLNDEQSLLKALEVCFHPPKRQLRFQLMGEQGASVIFGVTDYGRQLVKYGPVQAQEKEYQQAINLANAAAATTSLDHYIWSPYRQHRQSLRPDTRYHISRAKPMPMDTSTSICLDSPRKQHSSG